MINEVIEAHIVEERTVCTYEKVPQLRILPILYCGRKCFYCRSSGEGALSTERYVELRPDDFVAAASAYADLGGREIKVSGGDPALYTRLVEVVERIRETTRIENIEILSRHPRFGVIAGDLASAGATLFNVSLDTLCPERHRFITGVNDHNMVLEMIGSVLDTGVPMKINMVVASHINDDEIEAMVSWCEERGIYELKLLDLIQDLDTSNGAYAPSRGLRLRDHFVSMDEPVHALHERAIEHFSTMQGGLGHPMLGLVMPSGLRVLVKDHTCGAWYGQFCKTCSHFPCHDALMALRVTPDFCLQPCLLREDLMVPMADGTGSPEQVAERMRRLLNLFDRAEFHTFHKEN